jgi:hypothetical protein
MKLPEGGVSPLAINIMLACYVYPDPAKEVGQTWFSHAGSEIRAWLIENDLIQDGDMFRATERGKAWVEFICATPVPVAQWRLPQRDPGLAAVGAWQATWFKPDGEQPEVTA